MLLAAQSPVIPSFKSGLQPHARSDDAQLKLQTLLKVVVDPKPELLMLLLLLPLASCCCSLFFSVLLLLLLLYVGLLPKATDQVDDAQPAAAVYHGVLFVPPGRGQMVLDLVKSRRPWPKKEYVLRILKFKFIFKNNKSYKQIL